MMWVYAYTEHKTSDAVAAKIVISPPIQSPRAGLLNRAPGVVNLVPAVREKKKKKNVQYNERGKKKKKFAENVLRHRCIHNTARVIPTYV